MKSEICRLYGSGECNQYALAEAERFAAQCGLDRKRSLRLRLLSEELLGLVNGVAELEWGEFQIEQANRAFRLHLAALVKPMGEQTKKRLLDADTAGVNRFYQGVSGKIRLAIDWLSEGASEVGGPPVCISSGFYLPAQDIEWSLKRFQERMEREKKAEEWDELEHSVLSRLSEDIRVGFSSGKLSITITAKV